MKPVVFRRTEGGAPYALLRRHDDFGIEELDLLRPPGRFWSDGEPAPDGAQMHVDARRLRSLSSPAALLTDAPADNWMALTRRSLARLNAWFLVVEDPQRRLDVQPIVTLAHQASVVQHIATQPSLQRVLLADEVGLGKTVEAGLLIKHLIEQKPGARILYLAPARLVRNVRSELDRLGLNFRSWVASADRDATLKDPRVVASIHRASYQGRIDEVVDSPPWDMIVVDECHHLSDWAPGGGKPVAQYKLVERLVQRLPPDGRLLLMSGTPHQGHPDRFKNVLRLLRRDGEPEDVLRGRVIYRTKEDVRDWDGRPLFPTRQVNPPLVLDVGADHQEWLSRILDFFEPSKANARGRGSQRRAAGWRASQALQWATSSVQAGLGYLVRQAIRARFTREKLPILDDALAAMRPYRMGPFDESLDTLYARIAREVQRQIDDADVEDIEDEAEDDGRWRPDPEALAALLEEGVGILREAADTKWDLVWRDVLKPAGREKVVLFAQPIETVTAVADFLERKTGKRPAMIIGNQSEEDRAREVAKFWEPDGPQFLVSSRAGGEGLNLQVARRLVHLDVPWNPMELEQRIGRVHRFKSRKTIIVDTLVVKDSREVDTYDFARQKLREIASTLDPERFEVLFSRVMALVPPEDLQDVLAQGPVGPLSDEDRKKLSELVSRGFEQWKSFHERYSAQRREIRDLEPGEASWDDLAAFARTHLQATNADDFAALRFTWDAGEVRDVEERATVLSIGGKPFACGDYGGMPVVRADGATAERLGTNIAAVTRALRACAFPDAATGPGHLRWPDDAARPIEGPFGLLVLVRQSVRWEGGAYVERATTLHCTIVDAHGKPAEVGPRERGPLIRALLRSSIRREPHEDRALASKLVELETEQVNGLRRPTDEDRQNQLVHAVTPLLAAIVA